MQPANRIIFNTGILYIKLIIGMTIGLFATRLVLDALGETDFGIYALVAGVVGMLGILNSSMANASMRFMSHSLGTGNEETIKKTFNTTLFLHFIIGLIVIIIMEIGGLLMFKYLLNIPEERLTDAKIIFHFMVVTTFITIISVPYDAVINSHENILALSVVDLSGSFFSLGIAVYLTYIDANLLVSYGFFTLLTQIILRIIKQLYSRSKYMECKINFKVYVDKELSKTILSFSGWNMLGSIAGLAVTQVRSIFLNMFFGVSINAANGISTSSSGQINMVSVSMTRALNPQLVKSEGRGDRLKMLRFTEISTKFSVFLFAIFSLPVILEAQYLINLWLKVVPKFAVIFFQLILLNLLLEKFTFEITSAIRAVGNIRNFQVAETVLWIFNIPIYYIVLKMGYPPYSLFLVSFLISFLGSFLRLYFGKKIAGMDIQSYIKKGVFPVIFPILSATFFALASRYYLPESFLRLFITTIASFVVMTTTFYFWGLEKNETEKLKQITLSFFQKLGIKK